MNQKGQSLMESLVVLPFSIMLLSSLSWVCYAYFSSYLIDYWVYQSTLCLVKENPQVLCRSNLKENLSLIPFYEFKEPKIKDRYETFKVEVNYSIFNSTQSHSKEIEISKTLPLEAFE